MTEVDALEHAMRDEFNRIALRRPRGPPTAQGGADQLS